MIIGTFCYGKTVFGKEWMKIIVITDKDIKKKVGSVMIGLVIVCFLRTTKWY